MDGRKHKLPLLGEAAVWTAFQPVRNGEEVLGAWNDFIEASSPQAEELNFTLQLNIILDMALKKMLRNEAESMHTTTSTAVAQELPQVESNAIRYMAGYVAVKLLKKYRCTYKNEKVLFKHKLFVQTLEKMRAYQQPGDPDTVLEYSTLWIELIDRGGLYEINDDVFRLFESIEMVVRRLLNTTTFDHTVVVQYVMMFLSQRI